MHTLLREQVRTQVGRDPTPSAAIIDSQSVRTTEAGGPRRYGGGKKINGRKRHLLGDTLGLVMGVVVHEAGLQDRAGAARQFEKVRNVFPRMQHVWANDGYTGKWGPAVKQIMGWTLEVIKHPWAGNERTWARKDRPPPPSEIPEGFVVLTRH